MTSSVTWCGSHIGKRKNFGPLYLWNRTEEKIETWHTASTPHGKLWFLWRHRCLRYDIRIAYVERYIWSVWKFLKVFGGFFRQYGCQITWPMMSWFFFCAPFYPEMTLKKFSYWSDLHMQLWRHNEGPYDVIKKSHSFHMRSTCYVPSLIFFSLVQRSKVFPFFQYVCHTTWHMTS